jgi:hypothetical protein
MTIYELINKTSLLELQVKHLKDDIIAIKMKNLEERLTYLEKNVVYK